MNDDLSDIADGLSTCLTTDGQSTMTAPIKAAAGNVTAPSYTFATDPNTGIYRKGADNIGVGVGGSEVLDISSTGLDVTGAITQNGIAVLPVGVGPLPWAGTTAPSGWLLCYGQSLLRASYAALFAAIGTTYGAADGTHFNLPDMRGRVAAGKDDMGGSAAGRLTTAGSGVDGATLGANGGAQNYVLLQANLPAFKPAITITDPGHIHVENTYTGAGAGLGIAQTAGVADANAATVNETASSTTGITAALTDDLGSGTATPIVQPTLVTNYIIYAGV